MLCQILCVCVCVVASQYLHAKTHSKTKRGQDVSGAGLCARVCVRASLGQTDLCLCWQCCPGSWQNS